MGAPWMEHINIATLGNERRGAGPGHRGPTGQSIPAWGDA